MKIEDGKRVRLKIKMQVSGGEVIEQNVVEYFHGGGTMLPGIENILQGLEKGSVKKGTLSADKAFGDPKLAVEKKIARKEFPEDAKFEKGQLFQAKGPDGNDVVLLVEDVDDETIHCVIRHPLAEKDLDYELEVLAVTDPKPPPMPAEAILSSTDD